MHIAARANGTWPRVSEVREVEDGEVLTLGDTRITAHATPVHAMDCMSCCWGACEAGACKAVVFASSLNQVSCPGYRCPAPSGAAIRNGFTESYRQPDGLTRDILISPHSDNAGDGRDDARPGACRTCVERSLRLLATRPATERAGAGD